MSQLIEIHPDNPQARQLQQAVEILRRGGVIIYPTDSSYAFGCHIGDKAALDRIRQIRQVNPQHNFTLVCRDLSEISTYAKVDNSSYRLIKALTPGPYTFILKASREVPRRLQHPKRNTIGLRIPDNRITQGLLETLGEPIMSSSLIMPGDDLPMTDPQEMLERFGHRVDLIIDGGHCGYEPTTVVAMEDGYPNITRVGKGDISPLQEPETGSFYSNKIH
ncbi:MAG: L-threonylcarbamoyladenylate synthase [Gammaproteobacteria bacterium]|nr:MAG: L-threonylcarbamoyladenylate synthase [Gammaproteobacteria bacterium]